MRTDIAACPHAKGRDYDWHEVGLRMRTCAACKNDVNLGLLQGWVLVDGVPTPLDEAACLSTARAA